MTKFVYFLYFQIFLNSLRHKCVQVPVNFHSVPYTKHEVQLHWKVKQPTPYRVSFSFQVHIQTNGGLATDHMIHRAYRQDTGVTPVSSAWYAIGLTEIFFNS